MSDPAQLMDLFKVFDKDGNGFITPTEIHEAMSNLGIELNEAQVQQMIKAADKNGDGLIDYKEFGKMLSDMNSF